MCIDKLCIFFKLGMYSYPHLDLWLYTSLRDKMCIFGKHHGLFETYLNNSKKCTIQ